MINTKNTAGNETFSFTQEELNELATHVQYIKNQQIIEPDCTKGIKDMVRSMELWSTRKPHQVKALSQSQVKYLNDILHRFDLPLFEAQLVSQPIVIQANENSKHFARIEAQITHLSAKMDRIIAMLQPTPALKTLNIKTVTTKTAQKDEQ